jgi:cytochrome P450/NADPH-cytochrome P450 reductase
LLQEFPLTLVQTLRLCVQFATGENDKDHLEKICEDSDLFEAEVLQKRTSLFDVLTERESIFLPFGDFLASLPPMGVRQYSISSSPLDKPGVCTITFGIISAPSLSNPNTSFEGVASTYLSSLSAGDFIQVSSRPTAKKSFRLPVDDTPLLMFCAGTGLAPFRGFVQQRAIQLEANPKRKLSRAMLFIGCRSSTRDRLYAEELDEWAKIGAVEVKYAFSKEKEESGGCAYVSDRMLSCTDDIIEMWRTGARIYVCGSRGFAESLHPATRRIFEEAKSSGGPSATANVEMFERNMQERVVRDIFD